MLQILAPSGTETGLRCAPSDRAIVSFTTERDEESLELIVSYEDGTRSEPLPYVLLAHDRRRSLGGRGNGARIDTDVVHADTPIVAIDVRSRHPLKTVALSTPPTAPPGVRERGTPRVLPVPARSQFVGDDDAARGWCLPASLAMLFAAWGFACDVPTVARLAFDEAYGGTGNWTIGTSIAGRFGLLGAAAFVSGLTAAEALIAARLPFAASISWSEGGLPNAPLPASDGHLVVVRGFDERGDVVVNDPAHREVTVRYPRVPFERCWLGHGGVALLVAPSRRAGDLIRATNR